MPLILLAGDCLFSSVSNATILALPGKKKKEKKQKAKDHGHPNDKANKEDSLMYVGIGAVAFILGEFTMNTAISLQCCDCFDKTCGTFVVGCSARQN